MSIRSNHSPILLVAVTLLTLSGVIGQETTPDLPPIPAIPGIPAVGESSPPRMTPKFPVAPGPGLAVPGLGGTAAVKAERIKPEFQPGNTYRFVVKTELQCRTETGMAGGFTMEQQARFDVKVRVDGKPGVVLKGRTERLDMTLASGGVSLAYQSLKPEDQETPLGRHLRASLNRSVELTLDETGRVDASQESGSGNETALLPGVPRFGPEELGHLIASLPQGFSEKRVAPGDQWNLRGSRSLGGVGGMNFDLTYRHAGPVSFEGNTCASIEFAGELAGTLPDVNPVVIADFQASAMQGRIYFDPLDRMVRFVEQNIDLWITRPATESDPGGQIPVRQTTILRLLHVVPTP